MGVLSGCSDRRFTVFQRVFTIALRFCTGMDLAGSDRIHICCRQYRSAYRAGIGVSLTVQYTIEMLRGTTSHHYRCFILILRVIIRRTISVGRGPTTQHSGIDHSQSVDTARAQRLVRCLGRSAHSNCFVCLPTTTDVVADNRGRSFQSHPDGDDSVHRSEFWFADFHERIYVECKSATSYAGMNASDCLYR